MTDTPNHSRSVLTSSKNMTWETPAEWFRYLDLEFGFTLDPCCVAETAKCQRFFTPLEDGLSQSWADERVFMNPPYGREIAPWMDKAYREAKHNGALVVCLVPARVETQWWHNSAVKANEIRFPIGRLKFGGATENAPFPVAIVVFRPYLRGRIDQAILDSSNSPEIPDSWQPVSTAPRDGSPIILWVPGWGGSPTEGYFSEEDNCFRLAEERAEVTPTLWMPMPKPPKEGEHG